MRIPKITEKIITAVVKRNVSLRLGHVTWISSRQAFRKYTGTITRPMRCIGLNLSIRPRPRPIARNGANILRGFRSFGSAAASFALATRSRTLSGAFFRRRFGFGVSTSSATVSPQIKRTYTVCRSDMSSV